MKYLFLVFLAILAFQATADYIFECDFSKYSTQFEPFQKYLNFTSPATQAVLITEDSQTILSFPGTPTRYAGVVTTDWINSPSGNYYITVEFKGTLNKRTGGYIGFIRSDNENIYKTIGLDAEYNMDLYQVYRFNTTGTWNTYIAYLPLPKGTKIKLILEKGSYFGIKEVTDAKFRNVKVMDYTFNENCPGTAEEQIMQLGYVTFLFNNMELKNKIFTESPLDKSTTTKGKFQFKYASFYSPCLKTAFYGFDKNGNVIENFNVVKTELTDIMSTNVEQYNVYTYEFTMGDIEALGCASETIQCKGAKECTKYTCNYAYHFYYDKGVTYATKQLEYAYSSVNSQAIFTSSFYVVVFKESSTVLNTFIKTLQVNTVCTGICSINMDLALGIQVKTSASGTYAPLSSAMTVIWGDYLYIKIGSTPANYKLELMKVIITTSTETVELGEMFINSFIQNMNSNTTGQLTFEMIMSGESGLTKGKQFDLQFLAKTTAISRRNLEETELPQAQVSEYVQIVATDSEDTTESNETANVTKESETNSDSACHLTLQLLSVLLLLMIS